MGNSINGASFVRVADADGHMLSVRNDGAIAAVTAGVPEGSKFYIATLVDAPGVVAANNFLSVFNPVGSGKNLVFFFVQTTPWAAGATTTGSSMNVYRTTAASGGTLVTASTIGRFVTSDGSPVAEVRTNNPTVTTSSASLLGVPPAMTSAPAGAGAGGVSPTTPGASFFCVPGEGVVWHTDAGDVDQRWNFQVIWCEF